MEHDKDIRQLLDLYFEGEATLEQEKRLKEFFAGSNVPADLEYARAMFGFFGKASGERMGDPVVFSAPRKRTRARGWMYRAVSAAAVVAIAAVVTFKVTDKGDREMYCYVNGVPVTDMELAARQAEMAVRILEGNVKASAYGLEVAGKAGKPLEQAVKIKGTDAILDKYE